MRLHWGHGVFAALALFVAMMAWFMVRAINNTEELVTEDYYKEELRYQERIDEKASAELAGEPVKVDVADGHLTLVFPASVKGGQVEGSAHFMKPNDSRADRTVPFTLDSLGTCVIDTRDWMKGVYQVDVTWTFEGKKRLSEERIDVR
jgi:hypothetical protein